MWSILLSVVLGLSACATTDKLKSSEQQEFLDQAEASFKQQVSLPAGFWTWLDTQPEVRQGLLLASDPVNPQFAANLASLQRHIGIPLADKYAHLLLAMALTPMPVDPAEEPVSKTVGKTPRAEKQQLDKAGTLPEVQMMVDYLVRNNMRLSDAMTHSKASLEQAGLDASGFDRHGEGPFSTRDARPKTVPGFWDKVALASKTFPDRGSSGSLLSFTQRLIRQQEALGASSQPSPLFPLSQAPYPIMALLHGTNLPDRELDYIWTEFTRDEPSRRRLLAYGKYTWDYEKIEIAYKQSSWNPLSIPRLAEDGGVCGRLSTMGEVVRRMLGVPTTGLPQPGHRAFLAYGYNPRTQISTIGLPQSIAGPEKSTAQWLLPVPATSKTASRISGISLHYALASILNRGDGQFQEANKDAAGRENFEARTGQQIHQGLAQYHQSLMAYYLAQRETNPDNKRRRLGIAIAGNPYNLFAWLALAEATPVALRPALLIDMQRSMRSGISAPITELIDPSLPGNADLSTRDNQAPRPVVKNIPDYGNYLAASMTSQLTAILASAANQIKPAPP